MKQNCTTHVTGPKKLCQTPKQGNKKEAQKEYNVDIALQKRSIEEPFTLIGTNVSIISEHQWSFLLKNYNE